MILGIALLDWLIATGLITFIIWLGLYLGFLLNLKKPINVSMYFQAMFKGYKNSELRIGWSSLIFGIEYFFGLIIGGFIKLAWYPAQWTKKLISFILFGKKRKDRIERDLLRDKPQKHKDNGGVY